MLEHKAVRIGATITANAEHERRFARTPTDERKRMLDALKARRRDQEIVDRLEGRAPDSSGPTDEPAETDEPSDSEDARA